MAQLQDAADDRDLNNEIKDEKHRKKRAKQRFNGHGPQVVEPMGIFDPSSFIPSRPPPPPPQPTRTPPPTRPPPTRPPPTRPPPTKFVPVQAVPTNHLLTPKPLIHHHGTFSPLRNQVSVGPPPTRTRVPPGPKLPFEQPKATMHGQLKPPPIKPVPALRFQDQRKPLMFPTVRPPLPPPPPRAGPKSLDRGTGRRG